MSEDAMNKAYWQFAGATLDSAALAAFRAGWRAAMAYMSQPRIVSTPVHKGPDQVTQRFVTDEPMITWTEADHETLRRICEEYGRDIDVASACTFAEDPSRPGFLRRCHNPHGLVAFYTDAP